jgi:hypothetical protein
LAYFIVFCAIELLRRQQYRQRYHANRPRALPTEVGRPANEGGLARGHRDGVRCDTTAELDMLTLIWTRGEAMAFDLLPERSALPHLRQPENSSLL